ncbi:hypothetical protein PHLCEN_2v2394 [Hermanssonia centrifuga]|uniref:Uncharacterized protein n=1 Tax=Hermanssonia centrifuga TaxID=98765 RepID=A0A2R6RM24_9APHY|nr:hypothetical protein PHLCEN_2v2394 [Hermanssonia centrifuga]
MDTGAIVFFQYHRHALIAATVLPDLPLDIVPLILQHLRKKTLSNGWHPFQHAEDPFFPGDLADGEHLSKQFDEDDLFSFSLCSHAMRRAALPFIFESMHYRFERIWHKHPITLKIADEQDLSDSSICLTPDRPKGRTLPALQGLYEFMAITSHIAGIVKNLQLWCIASVSDTRSDDTPGQRREEKLHHIDIGDLGKFLDLFGCLRALELQSISIDVPQSYKVLEAGRRTIDRLSFGSSPMYSRVPTMSIRRYLAPLLLFGDIKKLVLDSPCKWGFHVLTDGPPVYLPFSGESLVVNCGRSFLGPVLDHLVATDISHKKTHLKFMSVWDLTHSNISHLDTFLSRFGARLVELEFAWSCICGPQALAPNDDFKLLSYCKNLRVLSINMFGLPDTAPLDQYNNPVADGLKCLLSSCDATSIDLMLEVRCSLLIAIQDVLLDLKERRVLRSVYLFHLETRLRASEQILHDSELERIRELQFEAAADANIFHRLWKSGLLKKRGSEGGIILGDHA